MAVTIRELRADERGLLREFLYLAVHVPPGAEPAPADVVDTDRVLQRYLVGFGQRTADLAFAADADGDVVGIAWSRLFPGDAPGYGYVDDDTPELAVAVRADQRGQGVGARLVEALMAALADAGFAQVSLSVDKTNPAQRLYQRLGFTTVRHDDDDLVMVRRLLDAA
ncbi:MAG: GNAT family N-acetyltransferase [Micrococcales bacterium]|nr:GNAT family N-acetyltransferase [Micrococcales bacterium]